MDMIRDRATGWGTIRRRSRQGILAVGAAAVLLFLAHAFVIQVFTVSSASMAPILLPRDSVLVNEFVYRLHPPRRGDIIVFHFPQAAGREFVKRVIGLPGDVVEEQDGEFYVNRTPWVKGRLNDPDHDPTSPLTMAPRRVPPGHLFVLGDNQNASLDSRFWGTVDEHNVIGKAFLIYWSRGNRWWEVRWDRIGYWLS